jgi:acylphosphatase
MVAHVFISGFVQGVGFRRFVRHHALKLGLTGWVKNLSDNRVEAVFQGSKEKTEEMIEICKRGPFLSEAKDVAVGWENSPVEAFKGFEILFD